MKKIYSILLLLLLFVAMAEKVKAQSDSLALYDLVIVDELAPLDTGNMEPLTDLTISVLFKINNPAQASKVFIQLGSAKDLGDIRAGEYTVSLQDSTFYLVIDGTLNKIWGQSGVIRYTLTQQEYQNLVWVTAYAKDSSGNFTEKKYFSNK